ncbi:MAG: OmpA family protein [Clostridiales bacterium]|nr:OmpA family protein [Clostridiales bacterium]
MKTRLFLTMSACTGSLFAANQLSAQEAVVVEEEQITVTDMDCKTHYYTKGSDNWFLQLGAGINSPFMENRTGNGRKHQITPAYNLGIGKWFSPYLGVRLDFQYSQMKWKNDGANKAKYVNANVDLMWDMFNSFGGVNSDRVFSIVPFVGIGGTYAFDFDSPAIDIMSNHGTPKSSSWTLPVSAGLQFRFRLCEYVDFFLEGRAQFYGDNFNLCAYGEPIDLNITALGGFNINFGGRNYRAYNPCNDLAYVSSLNDQVNALRADLATTAAALATAESQLPCPETQVVEATEIVNVPPMIATVRFSINSSTITDEEMVNVFNLAEYLKANPDVNVVLQGYADKGTGTAEYNMSLSKRRAQAVYDALTKNYGIKGNRLSINAEGSSVQPYSTNDWNRIVIFEPQAD